MQRFFVSRLPEMAGPVELPADAAHHAMRVLRLSVGDRIVLFDGSGREWPAVISAISRHEVQVICETPVEVSRESPLRITLWQGISSGDRMDYTLQKAVELGVARIVPLACQRSVVKLAGERADKRRQHWQQLVVAACEQCGRNQVPEVGAVAGLEAILPVPADSLGLWMDPRAAQGLRELSVPLAGEIILLAGPEGGFSPEEENLVRAAGFLAMRLGPRVLRTETAAVAALSALQVLWGDLAG